MYNNAFKIRFWMTLMQRLARDVLEKGDPRVLREPGSGLWIEKQ